MRSLIALVVGSLAVGCTFDGGGGGGGGGNVDRDGDGIANLSDLCPDEAETYNGYQDTDGCPDIRAVVPPSSFTAQYGVQPNAGLSFDDQTSWGFGVTANGGGGWTVSMLGNPDFGANQFFGSVYVGTGTIGSLGPCQTCQATGTAAVSAKQVDFNATISGAGLGGFSFVHEGATTADPIYVDAFIDGFQTGAWKIYFVSSDTGTVVTAPENPIALVSP